MDNMEFVSKSNGVRVTFTTDDPELKDESPKMLEMTLSVPRTEHPTGDEDWVYASLIIPVTTIPRLCTFLSTILDGKVMNKIVDYLYKIPTE